mmetsp:Transcript_5369/g.7908  ORF Transcript_5369/g.7908 Transcript_5369/m.7908 type:complete len:399 (+) Transcript_5369:101-1297(+)
MHVILLCVVLSAMKLQAVRLNFSESGTMLMDKVGPGLNISQSGTKLMDQEKAGFNFKFNATHAVAALLRAKHKLGLKWKLADTLAHCEKWMENNVPLPKKLPSDRQQYDDLARFSALVPQVTNPADETDYFFGVWESKDCFLRFTPTGTDQQKQPSATAAPDAGDALGADSCSEPIIQIPVGNITEIKRDSTTSWGRFFIIKYRTVYVRSSVPFLSGSWRTKEFRLQYGSVNQPFTDGGYTMKDSAEKVEAAVITHAAMELMEVAEDEGIDVTKITRGEFANLLSNTSAANVIQDLLEILLDVDSNPDVNSHTIGNFMKNSPDLIFSGDGPVSLAHIIKVFMNVMAVKSTVKEMVDLPGVMAKTIKKESLEPDHCMSMLSVMDGLVGGKFNPFMFRMF